MHQNNAIEMAEQGVAGADESEFMREIKALQAEVPGGAYRRAKHELRGYLIVAPHLKRVDLCHGWTYDDVTEVASRFAADGLQVKLHESHRFYYLKVKLPASTETQK